MSREMAGLSLLLVGFFSVCLGISGTLGYRRQTYILPNYYSGGINYASLPCGVMSLLWGVMVAVPLPEQSANVLGFLGMGFGLLGLLFNFVQPKFLTPHWLTFPRKSGHKVKT